MNVVISKRHSKAFFLTLCKTNILTSRFLYMSLSVPGMFFHQILKLLVAGPFSLLKLQLHMKYISYFWRSLLQWINEYLITQPTIYPLFPVSQCLKSKKKTKCSKCYIAQISFYVVLKKMRFQQFMQSSEYRKAERSQKFLLVTIYVGQQNHGCVKIEKQFHWLASDY